MPLPSDNADYYKDEKVVENKSIGNEFPDCLFKWNFPAGLLVIKNDSTITDIEYSFDGVHVAGRLKRGSSTILGGEWFQYDNTIRQKIYLRRAHDADGNVETEAENTVPFRLWANKEPANQ